MPTLPTVDRSFSKGEHHVANEMDVPAGYARRIHNFVIDNSGVLITRGLFAATGSGGHSVFTMPDDRTAYFFDGSLMYRLDASGAVLPVFSANGQFVLPGGGRVWYVVVNDTLYFSNGNSSGKVGPDGVASVWGADKEIWSVGMLTDTEITPLVVEPFPATQYLTLFGGKIYGAVEDIVFMTQPLDFESYDPRYDFLSAPSKVVGMGSVTDGIYVGTDTGVFFYVPGDGGKMRQVSMVPMIPGSQVYVPYAQIGVEKIGEAPMADSFCWLTREGLAVGLPGGRVSALTSGVIKIDEKSFPVSNLVDIEGSHQVVSVLKYPVSSTKRGASDTVSVAY